MNPSTSPQYQQVVFKASHNSYDVKNETLAQQLTFHPDAPANCGCRGLELDIWRHSGGSITVGAINSGFWTVNHLTNQGDDLSIYLAQLSDWHDANPQHDPVWVTIDVKSLIGSDDTFPEELDNYLLTYFGRGLIMAIADLFPGFTGADGQKLSEVAKADGWPTLAAMQGKFIFCISGDTDDWKKKYYQTDLPARLCLVDSKDPSELDHPNSRVVYNVESGKGKQNDFTTIQAANMLIRVYDADSSADWKKAATMGASILATNAVAGSTWACVGTAPFAERPTT